MFTQVPLYQGHVLGIMDRAILGRVKSVKSKNHQQYHNQKQSDLGIQPEGIQWHSVECVCM
jgi:hypothetical protein